MLVVHVGRPYAAGLYKKQWLFVSDGSVEENPRKNTALLAINISNFGHDHKSSNAKCKTSCLIYVVL